MQRIDQYHWFKTSFAKLFEHNAKVINYFEKIIDETYQQYLECVVFDVNNEIRGDEEIREAVAKIEFLQKTIERYIEKTKFDKKLGYANQDDNDLKREFIGIALIYELCIKTLFVLKNKINDEDKEMYYESILRWISFNYCMCSIFYACWHEIGMAQIMANNYQDFKKSPFVTNDQGIYIMSNTSEDKVLKFLSRQRKIKPYELDGVDIFSTEELIQKFNDWFWPYANYFMLAFEILRSYSMKLFIETISNEWLQSVYKAYFLDHPISPIRFLLPGQQEVLSKLNEADYQKLTHIVWLPTSWGKSLIAEMEIIKGLFLDKDKKVIYITPKVALCRQVEKDLKERLDVDEYDDKIAKIVLWGLDDDELLLSGTSINVRTPEKFLMMIWRNSKLLDDVSLMVFDEFHNIGNTDTRAIKMHIVLRLIKGYQERFKNLRLLLLSAMLRDSREIDSWIDWCPSISNLSPTRKIIVEPSGTGANYYKDIPLGICLSSTRSVFVNNYDHDIPKLNVFEKVFVYCQTRDRIEWAVVRYAHALPEPTDDEKENLKPLIDYARINNMSTEVITWLQKWVASYYRWLDELFWRMIIDRFKSNYLKVIVSNNSLLEWVNLDIEYIVADYLCTNDNLVWIRNDSLADLLNLVWRAGRFPFQSDGFILFTRRNSYYLNSLNWSLNIKSSEKLDSILDINSFESEFDIFFINRLWQNWYNILEISAEQKNEIITAFRNTMKDFFIWSSQKITDYIERIVSYYSKSENFVKFCWPSVDIRFSQTWMNNRDSFLMIKVFEELKQYWLWISEKDLREDEFDSIFPTDIMSQISSISIIQRNKDTKDNERQSNIKSYQDKVDTSILPWIIWNILWFLDAGDEMQWKKDIIAQKVNLWYNRLKYWTSTILWARFAKKYSFLPCELADELGSSIEDSENKTEIIKYIQSHQKYWFLYQAIDRMMK